MDQGRSLVFMQFGSHVYGTNVPGSDQDFKGVFIPNPKDLLLQRAPKTSVKEDTNKTNTKNTSEDIDTEWFTLQGFIRLCDEGQTAAMDMLFTPAHQRQKTSDAWNFIAKNKDKLIHKQVGAFVGYCQNQAAKYSIKGSRLASVQEALTFLRSLPKDEKLLHHWDEISEWVAKMQSSGEYQSKTKDGKITQFLDIVEIANPKGVMEPYLHINGRNLSCHVIGKYASERVSDINKTYGKRAERAKNANGNDWKALMHAVRIANEAYELLTTGNITFPRPEKDILLQIRKGELPYEKVAEMIENGVQSVDDAQAKSTLPGSIRKAFWEDFIVHMHLKEMKSLSV